MVQGICISARFGALNDKSGGRMQLEVI